MVRIGLVFSAFIAMAGITWSQPIASNGNCPELTRYNAPPQDEWDQFPTQPQPTNLFPPGTLQNSLDPQGSINCLSVPQGLKAEIIASHLTPGEGEGLAYFQNFDFDERGRVWALDTRDYPGPIAADKAAGGKGRILIFEDTDGDGAMDSFKEFYKGLTVPNSIAIVKGGVVVTAHPQIFFIPNNNDVGGTPEVLFSGGGANSTSFDTHSQMSSLMYSLDNWVYGITGWAGCNVNGVDCSGGKVWRFQHTKIGNRQTKFEIWTGGVPNAYGVGQMENGEIFQSSATTSWYSQHSIRQGEDAIKLVQQYASFYPPTTDLYLWEGSSSGPSVHTAVSGHDFYTARLLPPEFNNRLYVCEGATKHCRQDDLEVDGSTWNVTPRTQAASRIIGSTDAWFAPLRVKTGPDGGLWVVDWYNYLFLHNPAQPQIQGTFAWVNELRTKTKSHLYRIIPEDGTVDAYPPMETQDQLIAALGHSNFNWRLLAQRHLIYGGANDALLNHLEDILDNGRFVDDMENDPIVTHAIWVLEGLGELEDNSSRWMPKLQELLKHPAWATRRNVLRAMPRTAASAQAIVDECAVNDDHPHVRLEALVTLAESPNVNGETALWSSFDNEDEYITSARQDAGINTAGTRPCTPDYLPEAAEAYNPIEIIGVKQNSIPKYAMRFNILPNSVELLPHGQLESGVIRVYNLNGKEVFQSSYNSNSQSWSQSKMENLSQGAYTYIFMDVNNKSLRGKLNFLK